MTAREKSVLAPTFKLVKVYQTQLKVTFLLLKERHLISESHQFRIHIRYLHKIKD